LKEPDFVAEYEALEPKYNGASILIKLRLAKEQIREQLAKLLKTKQ
jgi:hypothetical protein